MDSVLYIVIVWISCVDRLSAEAEISVSGHVGSTVILPCKLQTADTEPHIKWNIDTETVFERAGDEIYHGEGYEGRVDVPEDELRKGNCSLLLNNLTLTDSAVYTSRQIVRRIKRSASAMTKLHLISSVNLTVYVPPIATQKGKEKSSDNKSFPKDDAAMTCAQQLILVLSIITWELFKQLCLIL